MSNTSLSSKLRALLVQVLIALFIAGCATETLSPKPAPLGVSRVEKEGKEAVAPLYYDFKDVPVPRELNIKREKSYVFQTTDSTVGLISFSGNLDTELLIGFFTNRMPEDGWRLLASFKSPKTVLFFLKENRFCLITLIGKTFGTDVEILLTPGFQKKQ